MADRPCYYQGKGRLKGSYTRIGDSDEPMTEYEVYSYEAYRKKYQDDIREVPRVTLASLDQELLSRYISLLKHGKPRLAAMEDHTIYELMSIKRNDEITLSTTLLLVHIRRHIFHNCVLQQLLCQELKLEVLVNQVKDF